MEVRARREGRGRPLVGSRSGAVEPLSSRKKTSTPSTANSSADAHADPHCPPGGRRGAGEPREQVADDRADEGHAAELGRQDEVLGALAVEGESRPAAGSRIPAASSRTRAARRWSAGGGAGVGHRRILRWRTGRLGCRSGGVRVRMPEQTPRRSILRRHLMLTSSHPRRPRRLGRGALHRPRARAPVPTRPRSARPAPPVPRLPPLARTRSRTTTSSSTCWPSTTSTATWSRPRAAAATSRASPTCLAPRPGARPTWPASLKKERKKSRAAGATPLTVAAGDLIGASPLLSAAFHDEPTITAMNQMGLDVASVGNHEFDEGVNELLRMQKGGCLADGPTAPTAQDSCPRARTSRAPTSRTSAPTCSGRTGGPQAGHAVQALQDLQGRRPEGRLHRHDPRGHRHDRQPRPASPTSTSATRWRPPTRSCPS